MGAFGLSDSGNCDVFLYITFKKQRHIFEKQVNITKKQVNFLVHCKSKIN